MLKYHACRVFQNDLVAVSLCQFPQFNSPGDSLYSFVVPWHSFAVPPVATQSHCRTVRVQDNQSPSARRDHLHYVVLDMPVGVSPRRLQVARISLMTGIPECFANNLNISYLKTSAEVNSSIGQLDQDKNSLIKEVALLTSTRDELLKQVESIKGKFAALVK